MAVTATVRVTRKAEEDQLLSDHESAMRQIMADPDRAEFYRAELSAWDRSARRPSRVMTSWFRIVRDDTLTQVLRRVHLLTRAPR
jgi:hypothetical protein